MQFEWAEEVPDDFRCCICLEPWNDPREAPCEHVFCAACISSVIARAAVLSAAAKPGSPTVTPACPECRATLNAGVLRRPTRILRQQLQRMRVRCAAKGCDWEGARSEFEAHHSACDAQPPPQLGEEAQRPGTAGADCDTWELALPLAAAAGACGAELHLHDHESLASVESATEC
eukprot:TRINITY_DN50681_c0_g1_i1.p1 TRINITY_DN50681_c0_g1~~TRINITY_DN50681_c0_g1_i1.p1  ORF type:complete len:199 (+),score=43.98 TRINITY_DN50681_c0_g1_i1:75-599(+)